MKVLIVEDETFHSNLYRYTLQQRGHIVVVTDNGDDGLEKFSQSITFNDLTEEYESSFDVVMLDIMIPGKSGTDIAKEIQSKVKNQKIVFATAYVKELLLKYLKEFKQTVEILEKPFPLEKLIEIVEKTHNYQNQDRPIEGIPNF